MKQIGSVEVPQEAFMAVLKIDDQKNDGQGCLLRGWPCLFIAMRR